MKCRDIVKMLEDKYDPLLKEEWDNVGLMVGDYNKEVRNIFIALDLNKRILEEAVSYNADMIITHHPFIFEPVKSIVKGNVLSDKIYDVIKNDICVYSMHTNLDKAEGGLNDYLFEKLGLSRMQISESPNVLLYRIGELAKDYTLDEFISYVKEKLGQKYLKVIGNKEKIRKVATACGSGKSNLKCLANADIDAYVTGDIDYHAADFAEESGMLVIDAGHYGTEIIAVELLKGFLESNIQNIGESVNIMISKKNEDPISIL